MKPKTIVGTGWWSDAVPHDWTIGTADTHSPDFFATWLALVRRYLTPDRIVVTDSHSPMKPAAAERSAVQWIELDRNYGHANDIRVGKIQTKHSGFMRSVYVGAAYALACDADYYVYLEQDCVIHGADFLQAIIAGLEHPIAVGARTVGGVGISGPAAPMLQQSLIVVAKVGLERFITAILQAPESDGEIPPEVKFERDLQPFSVLAVPFGRSRPLDFSLPHFYAQHLTEQELAEFVRLEGLAAPVSPPRASVEDADGQMAELSVEHPVLREIFWLRSRRPDLQAAFPLLGGEGLVDLVRWALISGVHEEPVLADLSSEVAELGLELNRRPRGRSAVRAPRQVHVVCLTSFPESFRNCAQSLARGLRCAGASVEFHSEVRPEGIRDLARIPSDEVIHILGQSSVIGAFELPHRNWLLTIHGAAPYSMPADLHPRAGDDLEALRASAGRLSKVICPSFAARREIAVAYGIPLARIEPVPHFFDGEVFRPEGARHDAGRPYFLAVSNYQPKKNYGALFDGFERYLESGGETLLLLAGGYNEHLEALLQDLPSRWPALQERVRFVGHAEDLASLYRGALALVSTSHQEGFGMPYIEAALCGTPVIGPRRSLQAAAWASQPSREILSGAGLFVAAERPGDLAAAMSALAEDPGQRAAVGSRCLARARFYVDPDYLSRRYLHVYAKVLEDGARA